MKGHWVGTYDFHMKLLVTRVRLFHSFLNRYTPKFLNPKALSLNPYKALNP